MKNEKKILLGYVETKNMKNTNVKGSIRVQGFLGHRCDVTSSYLSRAGVKSDLWFWFWSGSILLNQLFIMKPVISGATYNQ